MATLSMCYIVKIRVIIAVNLLTLNRIKKENCFNSHFVTQILNDMNSCHLDQINNYRINIILYFLQCYLDVLASAVSLSVWNMLNAAI